MTKKLLPMRPLLKSLQDKLAEMCFRFKKNEEIINIYEETNEKANGRFQSVYSEPVSLTNKHGTEEKWPFL